MKKVKRSSVTKMKSESVVDLINLSRHDIIYIRGPLPLIPGSGSLALPKLRGPTHAPCCLAK